MKSELAFSEFHIEILWGLINCYRISQHQISLEKQFQVIIIANQLLVKPNFCYLVVNNLIS